MKKAYLYSLLILVACYACEEKQQSELEFFLTVSPQELTFDENDPSKNIITVNTNTDWETSVDNLSLKLDKAKGAGGESQIQVLDAPAGKSCTLTIKPVLQNLAKDLSQKVVISRAPDEVYLEVAPTALTFNENDASKNIVTVNTNTKWEASVSDQALKIDKKEGTGGESKIQILDAPAGESCTLTISTLSLNGEETLSQEITVTRASAVERTIIYNNDFDRETATKGTYWPYLDQFDGWKNESGTGADQVEYNQMSVSVRSDWTSNYNPPASYRPYASGENNLYFNKVGSYIEIGNIRTEQEKDFILQFGCSENKPFDYNDLKVEVGNGSSWVELDYTRTISSNWELATSSFSLENATDGALGIRFSTTGGATQMRIDDVRLTDGDPSTQIIVFDNTVYPPAELPLYDSDDYVITHTGTLGGKQVRNYTMLYDKEKHAALWVAYPMHECYRGSSGRTEAWVADPLIEALYQPKLYGSSYCYYEGYSRGHQIPSADRTANDELNSQTFYASNMTPQDEDFNAGIWASLEAKVRDNMCSDTLYVVTGCYFGDGHSVTFDGSQYGEQSADSKDCPVPTHYFKVILRTRSGNTGNPIGKCEADELKAIGFWLEHRSDYSETFSTDYCKSVEYIEQQTGFTFFPSAPETVKKQCEPSEWNL